MAQRTLSQQLLHDWKAGLSEAQLAEKHNLTTVEVRTLLVTARSERRVTLTQQILWAQGQGYDNVEIARQFGLTESEVRILLKGEDKTHETFKIALTQLGTNNRVMVKVQAPLGMTYKEAYEAILAGDNLDVKIVD